MKKIVFISSTYEDLKEYRAEVWGVLEGYDVHVNGMEKFGARKETPLDTCLKEVERSDIYIGIISHRFGSIEPNSGKSYTQLEYEKAIELDKEIRIYLIDEVNSKVNLKFIDFGKKHEKLVDFKSLLKEKHTIDTFHNPDDLKQKLKTLLDELLEKKDNSDLDEECDETNQIVNKFELFPEKYNYCEACVRIELEGTAFPLSKSTCNLFGFEFGNTIGINFNFLDDDIKNSQIHLLVISETDSDFYFDLEENAMLKIIGRLMFSEERPHTKRAVFFDKKIRTRKRNPDYDPRLARLDLRASTLSGTFLDNDKYIYDTELIKGDGSAVMSFVKLIELIR